MVKLLVLVLCAVLAITSAAQTGHQRHNIHKDVDVDTGNVPTSKSSTKVATVTPSSTKEPSISTSQGSPTPTLTEVPPTKEAPTSTKAAPTNPTKATPTKATDPTPTEATPSPPTKATEPTPTKATPSSPTKATEPTPTKATPSAPTKATDPTPTKASPSTSSAPTIKPTPPHCKPGQKKTINGSCRDYVECNKSFQWVQKSCTTFCQVFDATKSRCVWNWQSPCLKPPTTVDPPTSQDPSTPSPQPSSTTPSSDSSTSGPTDPTEPTLPTTPKTVCTNGDTKPFQKGDCKDYLECDSNQWVKKTCSTLYDYDVNKKSCTFSLWAKCYK